MADVVMRNTIGQLMAAVKLLCAMEKSGRSDVVREIESCLSKDQSSVEHSRRLDRILKKHIDVLECV
jgi:hypothetical protein